MVIETCKVLKGKEVHKKLLKGSNEIAKAVSTTFGPYGKNVAITMTYNLPHVTKDGATVARNIKLEDRIENVAAQIINQAASKTAEVAGDGTTSTTILANALVEFAFKGIEKGFQPMEIRNKLREYETTLLAFLKNPDISTEVTNNNIKNIALVACNGDDFIAQLVTDAFLLIGEHGIITVSDSRSYDTTMDTTEGIKLDRSHIIPALNNGKGITKHKECSVVVTNLDIKTDKEALTLLLLQEEIQKPLLIICNDLVGKAAEIITYNKIERNIPIEVIRAPFIAEAREEALTDLATITGATLLDRNSGWTITQCGAAHLGECDSLEITLKETNIIGRKGDPEKIKERIEYYHNKIKDDKEGLKDNYKKRLAFFTSGAAVIYVGGANEVEVQEKKDRLDDTIRAVRSAFAEGYVRGGAFTYSTLSSLLHDCSKITEDKISYIMEFSLNRLLATLLENSNNTISIEKHMENVVKGNIIDPTLVIKSTIQNAIGAAIMIFTTDCVIDKEERN